MLLCMRIYDTMSNQIRDLEPKDPGKVSIYACGPTVQDVPHLGHARTALTYDVLKRYLEWAGFESFNTATKYCFGLWPCSVTWKT